MRGALLTALILSSAAVAVRAADNAQLNLETALRAYVASKSTGDFWVLKRAHEKTLKLSVDRIERGTIRRAESGGWSAVADFLDEKTGLKYFAEVSAEPSSSLWEVRDFRWLTKRELAHARMPADADEAAAAAPASSAPGAPGPKGQLPELTLSSAGGDSTFLPDCATPKCLTVVVAPWCPHCRKSTEVLKALTGYLPAHGVGMRVIVAADSEEKVRDYAESFGPGALLDAGSTFHVPGFPAYIVSTNGGAILSEDGRAPEDEKDPATFAAALGLP